MENEVISFVERQLELIDHLFKMNELSLAQDAELMLQKNLPLAAASYFEHRIYEILRDFFDSKSNNCLELRCFIENAAIKRKYHTLFDWDGNNVNSFLSLFGSNFKDELARKISADRELAKAIKDFLEIGNLRNCIIHQNYVSYNTEKTSKEIFEIFKNANKFLLLLKAELG